MRVSSWGHHCNRASYRMWKEQRVGTYANVCRADASCEREAMVDAEMLTVEGQNINFHSSGTLQR